MSEKLSRRVFTKLAVITAIGTVCAARFYNDPSPKPIARLISNEKQTWYRDKANGMRFYDIAGRWDATPDIPYDEIYEHCEGEAALLYEPKDADERKWFRELVRGLVDHGYAKYL